MKRMLILLFFFVLCNCNLEEKNAERVKNNPTSDIVVEEAKFISGSNLLAYWPENKQPDVIICDEIASIEEVKSALAFWENLGYKFGEVRKGDLFRECMTQSPFFNTIRIRLLRSDEVASLENSIAVTATITKFNSYEILYADIICNGFILKKRLSLEHEIGHALGWGHIHVRGHIMYPEWAKLGEDSHLVNYETYTQTILSVSL